MRTQAKARIAIIGAGFSGSLLAVQLLRRFLPESRIYLVEKNAEFGRGLAFATGNPNHLLNVRANRMSAFADQPEHFVRWLESSEEARTLAGDAPIRPDTFVPRRLYGAYIQDLLATGIWPTESTSSIFPVLDEAVALTPDGDGFQLEVAGGRRYEVDAAVLAIGNILSDDVDGHTYRNPWNPRSFEGLDPDAPVLLIGTGLTMVDTVITLLDRGHRGRIRAVSRRGLLPRRHAEAPPLADFEPPDVAAPRVNELLRLVRRQTDARGESAQRWRSVIDALRPYTQALWLEMPDTDRQRFLRHIRPWWDVHRHRMAPSVADVIEGVIAAGQLEVMAGRVRDIETGQRGASVAIQRRGAGTTETLSVARVIDCSGPICDYAQIDHGIVPSLLSQGLARPDSLRLGLDVTNRSAMIGRNGAPSKRLFAIGPVTRGTFWEITSVPDIREQCWQLAEHMARQLSAAPA